jgi:LysM repeat protein
MSPQPTLLRPVRRIPTRALDLTEFPCLPARGLHAVPQTDLTGPHPSKSDLLPPLVISLAPPFERATPLRLVETDTQRSVGTRRAAKSLTGGHIRLTRRGRLALLVAAVLCMLLGFSLGNTLSSTAGSVSPPTASHSIVVQPGQTLWGIATQVAPHADPRATVQQIIVLNHLPSTGLQVGQALSVPS